MVFLATTIMHAKNIFASNIMQVIKNAIVWAKPSLGPKPTLGHYDPIVEVKDKFEGLDDSLRKHEYIK